jgi:protein-disulfide isomerase
MEKTKKGITVVMGPVQLIMVALLIIGAYVLGTLKTKVDYLSSGAGQKAEAQPPAGQPAGKQPDKPLTADNVPPVSDADWVRGNRNAKVALIEYSDLECSFCKQFHQTAKKVVDEYKGDVMWVYRHYPLSFHPNAQKGAEAAECIGKLGKNEAFWKFIDAILDETKATSKGFTLDSLGPLAAEVGVDKGAFQKCLDSGEMTKKVIDQMDAGTKAGISGTPGNIIMNMKTKETRLIPGAVPFEQIKPVIDEMLNK